MTTITLRDFPTAVVKTRAGEKTVEVAVAVEPVNDHLAIAPGVRFDAVHHQGGTDFEPRIGGWFQILHLRTGMSLPGGGCMTCCRSVAREVAQLDVDWDTDATGTAFLDRLPSEARESLVAAIKRLRNCTCTDCFVEDGEAF